MRVSTRIGIPIWTALFGGNIDILEYQHESPARKERKGSFYWTLKYAGAGNLKISDMLRKIYDVPAGISEDLGYLAQDIWMFARVARCNNSVN